MPSGFDHFPSAAERVGVGWPASPLPPLRRLGQSHNRGVHEPDGAESLRRVEGMNARRDRRPGAVLRVGHATGPHQIQPPFVASWGGMCGASRTKFRNGIASSTTSARPAAIPSYPAARAERSDRLLLRFPSRGSGPPVRAAAVQHCSDRVDFECVVVLRLTGVWT